MQNIIACLLSVFALSDAVWGNPNSFPGSNPEIETRTLDQIYEAAQLETGELTVLWGGDGTYPLPYQYFHEFTPLLISEKRITKGIQ